MEKGYIARAFNKSPLFRIVNENYDGFQEHYDRLYSAKYGKFRNCITYTMNRFILCGDPREGVAKFSCTDCKVNLYVPFSCKTRLFCPTCHERRILVWVEEIKSEFLLSVHHRFWTFSIPKRLRPYFMYNRNLLRLLIKSANETFRKTLALTGSRAVGIIALVQTHGDTLEWNPHIHLIATDGFMDYSDLKNPVFHPALYWNTNKMTESFRKEVITILHKKKIITDDVATNLASWEHSGFSVHATDPFLPNKGDTLRNRLSYAFRPPACLSRMEYDETVKSVTYETKKGLTLIFTAMEFLAKLTLHIPDHYQNVRIYIGYYSSKIRKFIKKANPTSETKLNFSTWASCISRIFKTLPINCPNCKKEMEFEGFILKFSLIETYFPEISRAPPAKGFEPKVVGSVSVDYTFFD